jgi:PiT family inorganic phosphate transporter
MSVVAVVVVVVVLFLASSNGANDNFKGVATLWLAHRKLPDVARVGDGDDAGRVKGLVPAATAADPTFLAAAALGAALTVIAAARFGLPVSTTHALTGALVGAGLAARSGVDASVLGKSFFLPLLVSPLLAITMAIVLYPLARLTRRRLGIERTSCVCIDRELVPVAVTADGSVVSERAGSTTRRRSSASSSAQTPSAPRSGCRRSAWRWRSAASSAPSASPRRCRRRS